MVDGGTIEVYFPPKSRPGFYTDISSYYNLVRLINLVGEGGAYKVRSTAQ